MATSTFSAFMSNTMEEFTMIAGDEQTLVYSIYDENGDAFNLTTSTCNIYIFRYGDPTAGLATIISGSVSGTVTNRVTAIISGSTSKAWSGVYQHQPRITDYLGGVHIPAQGKIVVFPTNTA